MSAIWATAGLTVEWEPGAELVPVGDLFMPDTLIVEALAGSKGATLSVVVAVVGGVPKCVEVTVRGDEVRARDLAAIRLEDVLEAATTLATYRKVGDGTTVRANPLGGDRAPDLRTIRAARAQTRRRITPELLADVAAMYRAHFDDAPLDRISASFGVARRTAERYVELCRRDGHLPPTTPGKKAK